MIMTYPGRYRHVFRRGTYFAFTRSGVSRRCSRSCPWLQWWNTFCLSWAVKREFKSFSWIFMMSRQWSCAKMVLDRLPPIWPLSWVGTVYRLYFVWIKSSSVTFLQLSHPNCKRSVLRFVLWCHLLICLSTEAQTPLNIADLYWLLRLELGSNTLKGIPWRGNLYLAVMKSHE